jgi:hypothetical protein
MGAAVMGTKTVLFVEDAQVDYLDGQGLRKYREGERHTMRSDKADRWIRRNKAVEVRVVEQAPPAAAPSPSTPSTPARRQQPDQARAQSQEAPSGNPVASAPAVAGADGGGAGKRTVAVTGGGRSGPGV